MAKIEQEIVEEQKEKKEKEEKEERVKEKIIAKDKALILRKQLGLAIQNYKKDHVRKGHKSKKQRRQEQAIDKLLLKGELQITPGEKFYNGWLLAV